MKSYILKSISLALLALFLATSITLIPVKPTNALSVAEVTQTLKTSVDGVKHLISSTTVKLNGSTTSSSSTPSDTVTASSSNTPTTPSAGSISITTTPSSTTTSSSLDAATTKQPESSTVSNSSANTSNVALGSTAGDQAIQDKSHDVYTSVKSTPAPINPLIFEVSGLVIIVAGLVVAATYVRPKIWLSRRDEVVEA